MLVNYLFTWAVLKGSCLLEVILDSDVEGDAETDTEKYYPLFTLFISVWKMFNYFKKTSKQICNKYKLEKAMAPHSSTLAWKIPWTEEPGGLQSLGSLRVGHDWVTSLSLFTFMHWRRKWQPTPVFLLGESQGWGSLVGWRLRGCTELDFFFIIVTTEAT